MLKDHYTGAWYLMGEYNGTLADLGHDLGAITPGRIV
jgi:hypothetical protein